MKNKTVHIELASSTPQIFHSLIAKSRENMEFAVAILFTGKEVYCIRTI